MSDREKKLIFFFAIAGFVIVNFLGFNFAQSKRQEVNREKIQAKQKLEIAEQFSASREQVMDEMQWLVEHEPEPKAGQDVQTALQQLVEREARAAGLVIKSQKLLPTNEVPQKHFHRAQFEITVTGADEAIYRWFDKLNIPEQLRIASKIRLVPNNPDDTKLDCTATIAQWFVPVSL